MSSHIKTSDTHPIQIGSIDLACGRVGLTFCPGKHQDSGVTGNVWRRDLARNDRETELPPTPTDSRPSPKGE